ncbi:hypothetical protein BCR32DRAFT_286273 [Anaeromyces robustus]|uniref:Glutamate dehydrogenase n=1 Tax=Anaeromyces robustus TaxID=1754192 RepID=A0A1Y1W184_9FUNG|nr:hypothetical protein BCR32DRAFT_286273 [Anaeromyces robustus]|eukprot:ORX66986.1 hypothetical protein BCR32DRAFT_286273 [Anaeromyces robustus]
MSEFQFTHEPELKKCLPVITEPERVISFRVTWEDDKGNCRVNRGYRVQFNSAIGPYKGGLRFHPTVNLSILKFLGFEQIFKNALTGLPIGGGKGGSDFDPHDKSDNEIRRFCQAFMTELHRHIGADIDVPAGDIGVGGREVGFLYGAYNVFNKNDTHFGLSGSFIRPEATGYGLIYFVLNMLTYLGQDIKGNIVPFRSGNVAQFAAQKLINLGAVVLSLSDSRGALIVKDPSKPFTNEDIADDRFTWLPGERPWKHLPKVDIALPCATQNENDADDVEALHKAGCFIIAEGSNMGSTDAAVQKMEVFVVSALEMAQNSQRMTWTPAPTYTHEDLGSVVKSSSQKAESTVSALPSLVQGANITGFLKVCQCYEDSWVIGGKISLL